MTEFKRLFIKPADIKVLKGCSEKSAYAEMDFIRRVLRKKRLSNGRYQPVTFREYAELMGIDVDELYNCVQK